MQPYDKRETTGSSSSPFCEVSSASCVPYSKVLDSEEVLRLYWLSYLQESPSRDQCGIYAREAVTLPLGLQDKARGGHYKTVCDTHEHIRPHIPATSAMRVSAPTVSLLFLLALVVLLVDAKPVPKPACEISEAPRCAALSRYSCGVQRTTMMSMRTPSTAMHGCSDR